MGSSVVRLDRHPCDLGADERRWFFDLSRYAFMHRRKQLGAALRKAPAPISRDAADLTARFRAAGIDPATRPEQLTNGQWQALARAFAAAR